jgi:pimeloyl-ACP methyl ester carboxylesterase
MYSLALKGIFCILIEMPFNLAVLDINAADGIQARYPQIQDWYIGGHSLGGSMAASYLADHSEDFQGLVLLGSYSTADLTQTGLDVLSIFGSEDKVMNREKYDKYKVNLPSDMQEIEIDGGCHAYFGMYGVQAGDGVATLTAKEQICMTADLIEEFVSKGGN